MVEQGGKNPDKGPGMQDISRGHYEVTRSDLPLHCPMEGVSLWNLHPRVYLSIEATGSAKCPYCGAEYTLKDASLEKFVGKVRLR